MDLNKTNQYSAVIVAAGKGSRSGLGMNKVYAPLNGKCVLQHSLDVFLNDPSCGQIIVVCDIEDYHHYMGSVEDGRIILAKGGSTRQHSVLNGVCAAIYDTVMIHDGARPYIDQTIIDRCKQALLTHESALVCMPCIDTIKYGHDHIEKTLDRSLLYVAQTPQCFHTSVYMDCAIAIMEKGIAVTDDCQIMELCGHDDIAIVQGSSKNIKLTWPSDFN